MKTIRLDARAEGTRRPASLLLYRLWVGCGLLAALMLVAPSPALAHKDHKQKKAEATAQVAQPVDRPAATPAPPPAVHGAAAVEISGTADVTGAMDMPMDRSKMSFWERLQAWLGALHPFLVHFPIAFFPAALLTAVVGRRRPAFSAPVQFLVVAGGIFAPLAALLGWFAGVSADPEPILTYHRWLGVLIGVGGAALGYWAWRRPWEDRGAGMIAALSVMTVAIAAQGFLGASVTHGMDHMMF